MINEIILGDCFEVMQQIPDKSVDLIASDPPYNCTPISWDDQINLPLMWGHFERILKPQGVVILMSQQPFTTDLINSKRSWFRQEIVWYKNRSTGYADARKRVMRQHEKIDIFSECELLEIFYQGSRDTAVYNPQKEPGKPYRVKRRKDDPSEVYGNKFGSINVPNPTGDRYPSSVWEVAMSNLERGLHPTQKPIELFEKLILTYSNPDQMVFDPFGGSGTTAIAAYKSNRNFIVIEKEAKYHQIAVDRLAKAKSQLRFEEMVS